jgi:tetratricopeptide (TPR) repeat protein
VLYALGRLHLNRNQYALAARDYALAARHLRANAAPFIGQAHAEYLQGQAATAAGLLRTVLQQGPAEIAASFALVQDADATLPAQRLLGEILTSQGAYQDALPLLDQALAREPHDRWLRYLKGQCLMNAGQEPEAMALLRQVAADGDAVSEADGLVEEIRRTPQAPLVDKRFRIGQLYFEHDSAKKAEFWLRSVLNYAPDHAAARRLLTECREPSSPRDQGAEAGARP